MLWSQFSAKKIGVFLKTNVMINFFICFVLCKNAIFSPIFSAEFFGENILKIVISVPGRQEPKKVRPK
jgi:hypothetical protein